MTTGARRASGSGISTRVRYVLSVAMIAAACLIAALYTIPNAADHFDAVDGFVGAANYDFFQYYAAGHDWGAGFDPYRENPETPGVMGQSRSSTLLGYIYPPTLLPVLGALSVSDYDTARSWWLALSLLLLAATLAAAAWVSPGRRLEVLAVGVLLVAVSHPLLYHVRQGQIDLIVSSLATAGFLVYGRARSWPSALLLAAAVLVKLTPLVLVLAVAAYYRDARFLAKTAACAAGLVVVSLAWLDTRLYVDYVVSVLPQVSEGNSFYFNQSLMRLWAHTFALVKIPSLIGFTAIPTFAWLMRDASKENSGHVTDAAVSMYAFAVVAMLLFSPLSWHMAFVWVIVPFATYVGRAMGNLPVWLQIATACGVGLMCLSLHDHPLLDSVNMLGALLTIACLLWATRWTQLRDGDASAG